MTEFWTKMKQNETKKHFLFFNFQYIQFWFVLLFVIWIQFKCCLSHCCFGKYEILLSKNHRIQIRFQCKKKHIFFLDKKSNICSGLCDKSKFKFIFIKYRCSIILFFFAIWFVDLSPNNNNDNNKEIFKPKK